MISATEQVAILFIAEIRVDSCDSWAKKLEIRGQKNNTWLLFFHPTGIYLQKYVFCATKDPFSLFAYKKSSSFVDIHP